jgi:tRNA/rRNA methyltransferase
LSTPAVPIPQASLHWIAPSWFNQVYFVLINPSHPGNVGSAARAMRVMGLKQLRVVEPKFAQVAKHPNAIALASGALDVLAGLKEFATLDEALEDIQFKVAVSATAREFSAPAQSPEAIVNEVIELIHQPALKDVPSTKVAFVFGTERTGLSITQVQRCQRVCSIPGSIDYQSLNLAQAVQIMSYSLAKAAQEHQPRVMQTLIKSIDPGEVLATDAQVQAMLAHIESMLIQIQFLDPQQPKKLMPRVQRLANRIALKRSEVDVLRGICTTICSTIEKQRQE